MAYQVVAAFPKRHKVLIIGTFERREEAEYVAKAARRDSRNEPGARVRVVKR